LIQRLLPFEPDLLASAAKRPGFFPALLESQSYNHKIGRFDILFAAPSAELVAYNKEQLDQLLGYVNSTTLNQKKIANTPFQFGWFVYFSYESSYLLEPKLSHLIGSTSEPLAVAFYCQGAVVIDQLKQQSWLYAVSSPVADMILDELSHSFQVSDKQVMAGKMQEDEACYFIQAVKTAKELIQSGDVYQANLSRQYRCKVNKNIRPADVLARFRRFNPSPFAGMLQANDFSVVSSSPERLFSVQGGWVETRPIAGTRPRGLTERDDEALIDELFDTPKERAEHIMLIDLERNDVGKVCQIGTVTVDELMVIESYQHVHHIVSNIKGYLKDGMTFIDILKALFPGGTITGCPKIRCMEVIHQIEQRNRGCYTGSMGYVNHDGQVDLNILIRTVAFNAQSISFNAGAGIVFDSDPVAELSETKHKAEGLIRALS